MKDLEAMYLTDEFAQFSQEITALHVQKKQMKEEFKKIYEKFQSDVAAIDKTAGEIAAKWEAWQTEHTKSPAAAVEVKKTK